METLFEHVEPSFFAAIGKRMIRRNRKTYRSDDTFSSKTSNRFFLTFFGTTPWVCSFLWAMLKPFETMSRGVKPCHLLWTLMFMKVYATETVHASIAGCDEKTFRKWSWLFVEGIAKLETSFIVWNNWKLGSVSGDLCFITVDGTDFRIQEPRPFWTGWCSEKFNGPAVRYEIGICIRTGCYIVWIHGPIPAGQPDLTIFRSKLLSWLDAGEMIESDSGYDGEFLFAQTPCCFNANRPVAEQQHKRGRSWQEVTNRRFKHFNILHDQYRHSLDDHGIAFRAVAVITQINIEHGGMPVFSVKYDGGGGYY